MFLIPDKTESGEMLLSPSVLDRLIFNTNKEMPIFKQDYGSYMGDGGGVWVGRKGGDTDQKTGEKQL